MDQLLHNAGGSVFRLTRMAMLRAIRIHQGSPPLIAVLSTDKETTIALREIAQNRVIFQDGKKGSVSPGGAATDKGEA